MFLICINTTTNAQEFINCDLSGTITSPSNLPTSWLKVPFGDINCMATHINCATPDLTNYTQPDSSLGVIGNPYSGSTFVSGLFATNGGDFWHEGIRQTVLGFIPGNTYPINFHQAVVKQSNCLDSSGSWAVYIDTTLAGITAPTFSAAPYNSTSFTWESRTVTFVATAVSHTIKFLPMDDDTLWSTILNTGLRMGIDCIYITHPCDSVNTGIRDNNFKNSFTIYPNPVIDKLNIKSTYNDPLKITLYDISSRKLLQQKFTNSVSLNTEQLSKGIYLYEIRNKNGVIKNGKVVKE